MKLARSSTVTGSRNLATCPHHANWLVEIAVASWVGEQGSFGIADWDTRGRTSASSVTGAGFAERYSIKKSASVCFDERPERMRISQSPDMSRVHSCSVIDTRCPRD